jgi:hypothetical protein
LQVTEKSLLDVLKDSLHKKIQKAEKNFNLFEKVRLDKIKYIRIYNMNEIFKFTNNKIQKIINYFLNKPSTNFSNQNNFINNNSFS